MGVMPAIGSLGKDPIEYETAPTRRPSTYTGLPLMPAITPVWASGPPSSRARMRFRCGACTFFRTPRIRTVKSCSSVPSKTVLPVPTIPGFTSSIGIRAVVAGNEAQPNAASATVTRKTRIFMIFQPL